MRPRKTFRRQREFLEEFERVSDEKNNPELSGFFARVKDLFETLVEK